MGNLGICPACGSTLRLGEDRLEVVPGIPVRLQEADGPSFNDLRQRVEAAIVAMVAAADAAEDAANGVDADDDDDDFSVDVWIQDMGADWVVWQSYGTAGPGPGQWKMGYTADDAGSITLVGAPEKVSVQTTYVPTKEARDRIGGRVLEAKGTDASGGRVFDVQIIAFGDSKNGRRYPEAVMTAAAPKYEGAKAYDHHRTDQELQTSTIGGLIGSYQNVTTTREGIQAELHLLPSATHAAEALDASLDAQGKGLPPLVGISHDVMALYKPTTDNGKRFMEATDIVSVNSADVVADPAAGGRATRMVAGGTGTDSTNKKGITVNLKELLALLRGATAEKRAELLQEHAAVLSAAGYESGDVDTLLAIVPDPAAAGAGAPAPAAGAAGDGAPAGDLVGVGATSGTESVIARSSTLGRVLAREAVTAAGLEDRYVEAVFRRLPETFTEAQLTSAVQAYQADRVELEREMLGREGGRAQHVAVQADGLDKKIARLDATFDPKRGAEGYRSLKQAFCDITGYNPYGAMDTEDFNRRVLRESYGAGNFDSSMRSLESANASTWNLILGDSITRRMVAMYQQPNLQTWRAVVSSIVPIIDFRTQRIERLGGYGVLPGVNQGAPYQPLTTPTNEEATYAITKRGGTEDLTLETIANDDLRLVQRIPNLLGLAAAQTLYRFVWDIFITNPTYTPDSTALFVAGHNNTAATTLSNGNLSAARAAMRQQTAYGDAKDILSIVPKILAVPSPLEALAFELTQSAVALPTSAPDGGASNIPNLHQGMQSIVVDYWTATSSTAWFIIGDPDMTPTIELGFYNGEQDPQLFVQNDPTVGSVFTADKITYKVRHIYSGTALDFRALYRGNS